MKKLLGIYVKIEIDYLIFIIIIELILLIIINNPIDNYLDLQSDLISVSGIFSGILVALFSAKLFQEKSKKEKLKENINYFSEKLTLFRKIIFFVKESRNFWIKENTIRNYNRLKNKIRLLTLQSKNVEKEEKELQKLTKSNNTAKIYHLMNFIYGGDSSEEWLYDRKANFEYSLDELYDLYYPINNIWYYFDGRYAKHTKGLINEDKNAIDLHRLAEIREISIAIDSRFKGREIDRKLIADLGSDFHLYHIPELIKLTREYLIDFPKPLKKLFSSLVLIVISGIVCPMILKISVINFEKQITIISASILVFSFIKLLFDLKKMIIREMTIK